MGYLDGDGVAEDTAKGVAFLERAAAAGDSFSMALLGDCCSVGKGVDVSGKKAIQWWTQAAELGDKRAAISLGKAFEEGRGCDEDLRTALAWFEKVPFDDEIFGAEARAGEQRVRARLP